MPQIMFEVTRNGQVTQLQESVGGNDVGDLIKALKTMKEASNDALTKLLQEETAKNARKADEKDNDTDDTEEEEPTKEESRKKLKS
uniref:Putative secreted protein n=1 Tax=Aedes albopictus TaxID=7160 RepID=A0A023EE62_AEDAL